MVIRRVGPLSAAKIAGTLYFAMGLIFGAIVSLIAIMGSIAGMAGPEGASGPGAFFGLLFGAGAVIALPLFYGALGFVSTFLMALLYNAVAGMVGGIEIEVQ
jgi:hypothetical protein